MCVTDKELQELYGLIYTVIDGFNKTHDAQVEYVDFRVDVPADEQMYDIYDGSVVAPIYAQSIIDYHYRDLRDDDFDWFGSDEWVLPDRSKEVERIMAVNRREAQRRHREGTLKYAPWLHRPDPDPLWRSEVFRCL